MIPFTPTTVSPTSGDRFAVSPVSAPAEGAGSAAPILRSTTPSVAAGSATVATESVAAPSPQPSCFSLPDTGTTDVAVFWDFENMKIPDWCAATKVADCLREKLLPHGRIVERKLYYDSSKESNFTDRSDLDLSGFTLVDCPSRNNRKETLDKKLIVDVLFFAWERVTRGAKTCVALVTCDGDYSYALARLQDIGVHTIVIFRPDSVAKILVDVANVALTWETDVLGGAGVVEFGDTIPAESNQLVAVGPSREWRPVNAGSTRDWRPAVADGSPREWRPATTGPSREWRPLSGGPPRAFADVVPPSPHLTLRFLLQTFLVATWEETQSQQSYCDARYGRWALESKVALAFYEKAKTDDKERFKTTKKAAFDKQLVVRGRRDLRLNETPVVQVASWDRDRDRDREGYSIEAYIQLTAEGVHRLQCG